MMRFELNISTDNAAMVDDPPAAIAEVLRKLADKMVGTYVPDKGSWGNLYDVNGNKVGSWRFTHSDSFIDSDSGAEMMARRIAALNPKTQEIRIVTERTESSDALTADLLKCEVKNLVWGTVSKPGAMDFVVDTSRQHANVET